MNTKNSNDTVIAIHTENNNHTFNFNNFNILDKENNENKRLISEMLHIHLQNNAINKKEDTQKLNSVYTHLLYDLKRT